MEPQINRDQMHFPVHGACSRRILRSSLQSLTTSRRQTTERILSLREATPLDAARVVMYDQRQPIQWKCAYQCRTIAAARRTAADRSKPHLDRPAVAARLEFDRDDLSLLEIRANAATEIRDDCSLQLPCTQTTQAPRLPTIKVSNVTLHTNSQYQI